MPHDRVAMGRPTARGETDFDVEPVGCFADFGPYGFGGPGCGAGGMGTGAMGDWTF